MPDMYAIDQDLYEWIVEGVVAALKPEFDSAEMNKQDDSDSIWVELTDVGDESLNQGDFSQPYPYKGKQVRLNKTTHKWEDTDPKLVFDPDGPNELTNVPLYVYAVNGSPGLIGTRQRVSLHAWSSGTGVMYWGFNDQGESQLAKITTESAPGTYEAEQLDADEIATGKLYNGIELPLLTCTATGRDSIPAGTVVEVLKKGGNYYFTWSDPKVAMGAAGSSPAEANGTFNAFAELGSTYQGTTYNADPVDWIYKHNRMIAIGHDDSEGSGGTASGIKITQISTHDYSIELVDENGDPIDPTGGPITYCASIDLTDGEGENNVLTIVTKNSNNDVICMNQVELPTYSSVPTFNEATRVLTITSVDAFGNIIAVNEVTIPCCPKEEGTTDSPPSGPYIPTVPTNYPPNEPVDPVDPDKPYTKPCGPPVVTCAEVGHFCFPLTVGSVVSNLNINTLPNTGDFTINSIVYNSEGVDVTAFFKISNGRVRYSGGADMTLGKIRISHSISNTATTSPCDGWPDFDVDCYTEIKTCECNDGDSTHDGTGSDPCSTDPLDEDDYCEEYSLKKSSKGLCVKNKKRIPNDTGRVGSISVSLDIAYSGYPGGQTQLQQGVGKDAVINPNPPGVRYRKRVKFAQTFPFDPDNTWEESIAIPIQIIKYDAATGAKTAVAPNNGRSGRLELSYFPSNEGVNGRYVDLQSFAISPNAKAGIDGVWEGMGGLNGLGQLRVSVSITQPELTPREEDYVGDMELSAGCCKESVFEIVGGADADKFILVQHGDRCSIYVHPNVTTAQTVYRLNIKSTCTDFVGSDLIIPCEDTIIMNDILACKRWEDIEVPKQVGPGRAGSPTATIHAKGAAGVIIPDSGQQDAEWSISDQFTVNETVTPTDKELFTIEPGLNGEAIVYANVDLPPGDYKLSIQARNGQMSNDRQFLEQDITLTVDDTSDYEPSRMTGLS